MYWNRVAASFVTLAVSCCIDVPISEAASAWAHRDIGVVAVAGTATISKTGRFKIEGEGSDIGSTADAFHFLYQELAGDGTIVARLTGLENTNPWAKGGVMLRQSLTAGSIHASLLMTAKNGLVFERRTADGAQTSAMGQPASIPVWLRLVRSGGTVTASRSSDGAAWTVIATETVPLNGAIYVGLAVTSHSPSRLATGTFTNVTVSDAGAPEPPPPPPPTGPVSAWSFDEGAGATARDAMGLNNGTVSGASWTSNGRYGGALLFDGVDSLVTVADQASLDFSSGMTLEAWVNPTAVAGWRNVLLKESSGGLAYGLYASSDTSVPAGYVNTGAGDVGAPAAAPLPVNAWSFVAVTYDGTNERLFVNGSEVGRSAATGSIAQTAGALRIGGNTVWSEFFQGAIDNVRVYDRALSQTEIQNDMNTPVQSTPDTAPPSVTVTSPGNGAIVAGMVSVTASASDDVAVASVRILVNGSILGTATAGSPYTVAWDTTAVPNGTYSISAIATDGAGNTGQSAAVSVDVNNVSAIAAPRLVDFNSPDQNTVLPDGRPMISGYRLEVWRAGDDTSTAQPYTTTDMGKPSTTSTSISIDEQAFLATLPSGQQFFTTVLAIGPTGNSRSTASNVFSMP